MSGSPHRWLVAGLLACFLVCTSTSISAENPKAKNRTRPGPSRSETGAGRWVRPGRTAVDSDQQNMIDRLLSIGYLQGSRPAQASGVTIHVEEKVAAGFNLYSSGHAPEARLVDMSGKLLHSWRLPYEAAFGPLEKPVTNAEWWRRVHLFRNGDLLAIFEGMGLIKIDKNSKLIWKSPLRTHHDLEVQGSGDIYILTREARMIPRLSETAPILEDFITVLSQDGRALSRISLIEAFENSKFRPYLAERKQRDGDIFHTNTITRLKRFAGVRSPAFARGNILVSMNKMGIVAVVDPKKRAMVWARKTLPYGQHDPQILPGGTMLIFNNFIGRSASQVLEFRPTNNKQVWSYLGSPERPFHSSYLGTAKRLRNGNTLITESDGGRAFEVTHEKEIVWEFFNPHRSGTEGQYIATLPEVIRLPSTFPIGWTQQAKP